MLKKLLLLVVFLNVLAITGCSNGSDSVVVTPDEPSNKAAWVNTHQLWGYFQFRADPDAGTLDVVPLRETAMHLNVLIFLEPPPYVNLTVENVKFNGNIVDVDVGLRHPFMGLNVYTGFDVTGILISNGSITGFSDPGLLVPGEGDTRLLNPDGYTRWWNPSEFPINDGTMFCYQDGLLGQPYDVAGFTATLNGYKLFCDDLDDPDDPLTEVSIGGRALFSAGKKNTRHYTIEIGNDGLIFNYAVDANWKFPTGTPPWDVPDDLPPKANRPEVWRISVTELENTLYNDLGNAGGSLSLSVDAYDHFGGNMNNVRVEAPGEVPATESAMAIGGAYGFSTYQVDIPYCTPAAPGELELLISVESNVIGYGGVLPGKPVSAYFTYTTTVSDEPPQGDPWSEEFIAAQSSARFPVIAQTPAGRIIGAWSTETGVGWNEFTLPETWGFDGVIDTGVDAIRMSIAPGVNVDDIVVTTQDYSGTIEIGDEEVEYGHPLLYMWDGASSWDKWDTDLMDDQLMMHSMVDFEGRYQWFWGTHEPYGQPMHCQSSMWGQSGAFDYPPNLYVGYSNISELGCSRCWDEDSDGNLCIAYEFDRVKNPDQPENKRGIFIAAQYLPSMVSDAATFLVEESNLPVLDSPTLSIDSNGRFHLAFRRYTFTERWQLVYHWSDDGENWLYENQKVVWEDIGGGPVRRYISVDTDSAGRIHLTFMVYGLVYYTRSNDGVNWLPLEIVNESIIEIVGVGDHQPWMFVDSDDQVHVVWSRLVVYPGVEFGMIRHRWREPLP